MGVETVGACARLPRSRGSCAAAGSSPAATAPSTASGRSPTCSAFVDAGVTTFDCADIYTGVEDMIGALPPPPRRNGRGRTPSPASRCTPSSCRTGAILPRVDRGLRARHHRPLAAPARAGAPRPRAVPLVELRRARRGRGRAVLDGLAARGQDRAISAAPISTRRGRGRCSTPACRSSRCRCSTRCSTTGPRTASPRSAPSAESSSSATAPSPAASCPSAGSAAAEPGPAFANRSLTKYKLIIDDFGGWDLFQALLERCGRSAHARRQPRRRGDALGARPAAGRGRDRRRPLRRAPARQPRGLRLALDDDDRAAIGAVLAERGGPVGDTYTLERDRTGRHGRIMKYDLNQA